ncbi:MAG: 50S ribosomal protein L4 [Acidobacteria bacterium]|nr:50S ribosomal protein L4 [Acidobacteriota bacterium]
MAETTTLNAAAYNAEGAQRDTVALPSELFDGTVNMPVMHQAVKAYLANQRQGNASTKTRGFVIGGNQKPWKQKGTGRARQGSTRSPQWVGGGTVFGPRPRSYAEAVPRKVRALARKSALNARARENAIIVIDSLEYDAPKTSQLAGLLRTLGLNGKKVLILTDGVKPNVYMSGRNLTDTQVLNYPDVSTFHILWSEVVVIESSALGQDLGAGSNESAAEEPATEKGEAKPARAAAKSAAKSAKSTKKSTRKSATKTTGRKSAAKSAASGKSARKTTVKAPKRAAKKKGK